MDVLKTAREVLELEAAELNRHAASLDFKFEKAVELVMKCQGKLIVTGVGKSGHIGAKIAATLASTGTPSFFIHPTEALHGDLGMIGEDDAVLAISFSGESAELLAIMPHIKRRGIKILALAKDGSSLAALADVCVDLSIVREACPFGAAPTVSTTLTLALGDALAVCLMRLKNFQSSDFAAFHPGGSLGKRLFLKVRDVMRRDMPIIGEDVNLKTAINAMSSGKVGSVLLVDADGSLRAVLSDGDLRRALESEEFSLDAPALKFACKTPKTIENDDMLAYDALHFIEEHKIQLLVVIRGGKPAGMLHIHDLTSLGL